MKVAAPRISYVPRKDSQRHDWSNLRALLPYLWEYRGRVILALGCLVLAKVANVGVPLVLKEIVDHLDATGSVANGMAQLAMPVVLLAGYGLLKLAAALFNELRDTLFTRVRYRAMRRLTLRTLRHLHDLDLRFHLERKTGAISRDLQRGSASLSSLLKYVVFNLLPVAVEFSLVAGILLGQYDPVFTLIIFSAVIIYVGFTLSVTNWRMDHRHNMNRLESRANNEAMDSLINYETVKYFGNEQHELRRCDDTMQQWEDSAVLSRSSMGILNFGQGAIIAAGVTAVMFFAAAQVIEEKMTLGDLVLVNAFLLQLFIPLGFLGVVYRQIKYALADMDQLIKLLEQQPEIVDKPDAKTLRIERGEVAFHHVDFGYQSDRQILRDISFSIAPGRKLAVVGESGAGKSTLARLLFRFYDVSGGMISIDGQDIRDVTQASLRSAIAIVPQDTVLFNESIYYNLLYARPSASREEVEDAARMAHIHDFIMGLPQQYDTIVGERGLKLSGGEKQRVAIARAILKGPSILIFDEATSALDSKAERAILEALREAAINHTTLVIAHRLSTIVDADQILVMEQGRIIERGSHEELLAAGGHYADIWAMQQKEVRDGDQVVTT